MSWNPPPLPQTQPDWLSFQVWWQQVIQDLQDQLNLLGDAIAAVAAAQAAADNANAAAAAANDVAVAITDAAALKDSYPVGAVLTGQADGATAKITITAHTRRYPQPDGSNVDVAVTGGTVSGLTYDTYYYVYYDDALRAGGAVTYVATTNVSTATQGGARHTVGASMTPFDAVSPDEGGSSTRGGGVGTIQQ